MPVLNIRYDRLNCFLKKWFSKDQILEFLPFIGLDIEDFDDEEVKVEYSPNRPDFGSPAGIAKAINYLYFDIPPQRLFDFPISNIEVFVDKSVEKVRPCIFVMYAELQFSEYILKELISFQEDLHNGIGRKRTKFAIGLHDASKITPPIYYTTENRYFKFTPLNCVEPMTIEDVLKKTEQGIHYSHILCSKELFPIIKDSKQQVLSFPPIINGNLTTLTEKTKSLFVDVTSTEPKAAQDALALLATTLIDYGASVYKVRVISSNKSFMSPILTPLKMELNVENVKRILGIKITQEQTINLLKKVNMHSVKKGKKLEVEVPRYRIDVIHQVDLIEEVGYGYGYNNIRPLSLKLPQLGKPLKIKRFYDDVRLCLIGLGFTEVMNFYLSNKELQQPFSSSLVEVEAPKTQGYNVLRASIIPQLLEVSSSNIHETYPQKFFELGRTFELNSHRSITEIIKAASLISSSETNFTEIKSTTLSVLNYLGIKDCKITTMSNEYFIDGRCASIEVKDENIGILGEISPFYITKFSLRNPVTALEINLTKIFKHV
ncbi:MAG: phenylalanine--tRNA ligase subunit beta [Nitrososphaeria archaeon]